MKPKLYEDASDRTNQRRLIDFYMNFAHATYYDCPPNYPLDYLCKRNNKTVAFVECRKRNNPITQYPTIFVSLKKVLFGRNMMDLFGVPVIFLAEWSDGIIGTINFDEDGFIDYQEKNFRNDPFDREPVYHWNIDKFKILRGIMKQNID